MLIPTEPANISSDIVVLAIGHLGCCKDDQPSVVPIYFVYVKGAAYCFSMPGRKMDRMRENDKVCLYMDHRAGAGWISVIAEGKIRRNFPTSGEVNAFTPGTACRSTRTGRSSVRLSRRHLRFLLNLRT